MIIINKFLKTIITIEEKPRMDMWHSGCCLGAGHTPYTHVALGFLPEARTWHLGPTSVVGIPLCPHGAWVACWRAGHNPAYMWCLGCAGRDASQHLTWGHLALG